LKKNINPFLFDFTFLGVLIALGFPETLQFFEDCFSYVLSSHRLKIKIKFTVHKKYHSNQNTNILHPKDVFF